MASAFFKFFLQCHRLYNLSSQPCLSVLTLLMCPIFFLFFFSFFGSSYHLLSKYKSYYYIHCLLCMHLFLHRKVSSLWAGNIFHVVYLKDQHL